MLPRKRRECFGKRFCRIRIMRTVNDEIRLSDARSVFIQYLEPAGKISICEAYPDSFFRYFYACSPDRLSSSSSISYLMLAFHR